MPRRAMAAVMAAGLICVLGACKAETPSAGTPPYSTASPSIAASGPVGPRPGPHHYTPGASSAGDPLAPGDGNGGYDVAHYSLSITYDPTRHELLGDDVVTAFATQDLSRFDLDLHGLDVHAVQVDGGVAAYRRQGDELRITPAHGIDVGMRFIVHIVYGGVPTSYVDPEFGEEGFLPYGSGAIVAGEPNSAASWFPADDHPSDKATYDVNITAPGNLEALSNGLLVGKSPAPGGAQVWHWVENQPMASYLATVVIGEYRITATTDEGRPVVMAVDATLPQSYDAELDRTPEVIDFLEKNFGPYPFDAEGGIVHADRKVGFALESQSRPVYSPLFFDQPSTVSVVLAHELAHQWFGDSVSVAHWSDLWLSEGFATYAEWLWREHVGGRSVKQIFDGLYNGANGQVLPADPPGTPTAANLFGESVYLRGAATLEALRITVGDDAFFTIIKGWAALKRYRNGSTSEFIAYAERVSGSSLGALFHRWLFTRGRPPYPKPGR